MQKALPNCNIEWDDPAKPATKKLAYLDPAFQKWVKATQALPAEQQIEAVSKKLMELNPGFDGKLTVLDGRKTIRFTAVNVTDISPVRALTSLKSLTCMGSNVTKGQLSDLSPLEGMPIDQLYCPYTQVADLAPLAGMQLIRFVCGATNVSDLSPLDGMPLVSLDCGYTLVSDWRRLRICPNDLERRQH